MRSSWGLGGGLESFIQLVSALKSHQKIAVVALTIGPETRN